MPLPHKNSGNVYLVHTDANVVKTDTWTLFGTSKESEESEAESQVKKLEKELYDCQREYAALQLNYKTYAETMQEVANELKCLKVHDYFLEMYLPEAQKKHMHREKAKTREQLQLCVDYATYRSKNNNSLKSLTDKLMEYMKKRHDDDDDKAIFTLTHDDDDDKAITNSGNEYLVHKDANVVKKDTRNWFGTSKKSQAELQVKKLETDLYFCRRQYDQLQLQYKNYIHTMQEVRNELQCLKVHDYFLQMHLPKEEKIKMHREKNNTLEKLKLRIDDETSLTNKLNEYMQARHDDDDDKAIFTLSDFIKYTQMVY